MPRWPLRKPARLSETALEDDRRPKASNSAPSLAASQGDQQPDLAIPQGDASSLSELLGSVDETKEQHLARHGGGRKGCPRCRYYAQGRAWAQAHGRVTESRRVGPCALTVWLAERPVRYGGVWAVGCVMCASTLCREVFGDAARGSRRARRSTRRARFEVRAASLQSELELRRTSAGCPSMVAT